MNADTRTIAAYDERARQYALRTKDLFEKPELDAFAAALPVGGRVLDLGCGPGFYAGWLAAKGFRVDAVDASREMVALAATQPGVTARQARFADIDAVDLYDGIWANFSLLHAPQASFAGHLTRLKRAGRAGLLLHLGMKLGTGEGRDRLGRFFAYYSETELTKLVSEAGFSVTRTRRGNGEGLAGGVETFVILTAHA